MCRRQEKIQKSKWALLMNDQNQMAKFVGTVAAILTVVLGYGFIHGKSENPRPYSLKASEASPKVAHKVEARLWEDPFESFTAETNAAVTSAPAINVVSLLGRPILQLGPASMNTFSIAEGGPWNESTSHKIGAKCPVAYVAVMLPGGPYVQDKEIRLRLRYAIEVALLTGDVGPDDRTHILTNSIYLPSEGDWDEERKQPLCL